METPQWAESVQYARIAVALRPASAFARLRLAHYLERDGKPDESLAEIHKAIELDPINSPAHAELAVTLHRKGKLEEAIAEYRKAIELDPKLALTHTNLGMALRQQGKLNEAVACFRKAVELMPKSVGPITNLATLLAVTADPKVRDAAEALKLARSGVELGPSDASAWQSLGWALYATGAWKESVEVFKKSIDLQQEPKGGDSGQWFGLAAAHARLGDKEEARKWYGRAVQWMDNNAPQSEKLRSCRAEAEQAMNVKSEK